MSDQQDNSKESGIDLGLQALLERGDEGELRPVAQTTEPQSQAVGQRDAEVVGAAARDEDADLVHAFRNREYARVAELAEARFESTQQQQAASARLWWARAHLAARSLPLSVIVPSVEIGLDQLHGADQAIDPKAQQLVEAFLPEVCQALRAVGDSDRCVTIAERGLAFGDFIRPELRNAAEEYQARLRERERGVGVSAAERDRLRHLDQLMSALDSANEADNKERPGSISTKDSLAGMSRPSVIREDRRSGALWLLAVAGTLVGILWWLSGGNRAPEVGTGEGGVPEAQLIPESMPLRGQPSIPVAAPRELDSLAYDLSVPRPSLPASSAERIPDRIEPKGDGSPQIVKREVVDTSGPLESDVLGARRSSRRANSEFPQRASEQGRDGGARSPRVDDDSATFSRGDGSERLPEVIERNSPFEEYPSTIFTKGKLFLIVAPTEVLSEPRFKAPVITKVNPGDRVMVEEVRGFWLRIRSPRGKVGFILAQDAEEVDSVRE